MKIAQSYVELVGHTPLVRLNRLEKALDIQIELIGKVERFNPLSSVKDRLAKALIEDLYERNLIKPDTVIVEPTSGNTGIGLAFICAAKGIKLIIIMPETVSKERVMTLKALGATVILTDAAFGIKGSIAKAMALLEANPNYVMPQQFENQANAKMHKQTTAIEILEDTDHHVDVFIAGVGTGGTVTGVGQKLKETLKTVEIVAVEPADSPVISGGQPGSHKIQGIGAGFIPKVLDTAILDKIMTVTNEQAIEMTRLVAKTEGMFLGVSSGAALHAAYQLALDPTYKNKRFVVILPDAGERYLSTGIFE